MTEFPAFRITFGFVVRAEPAIIYAFVGWFDVKIVVEIYKIAVVSSSDHTCKQSEQSKIGFFVKQQTVFRGYPDIAGYLIRDQPEVFTCYMGYKVLHTNI
jgi:hypothetical protein